MALKYLPLDVHVEDSNYVQKVIVKNIVILLFLCKIWGWHQVLTVTGIQMKITMWHKNILCNVWL